MLRFDFRFRLFSKRYLQHVHGLTRHTPGYKVCMHGGFSAADTQMWDMYIATKIRGTQSRPQIMCAWVCVPSAHAYYLLPVCVVQVDRSFCQGWLCVTLQQQCIQTSPSSLTQIALAFAAVKLHARRPPPPALPLLPKTLFSL